MIRYVWFDLGYTLVKTNREEVYLRTLERFACAKTLGEITIAYHLADKLFMREFRGVLGKDGRSYLPWYIGVLNYYLGLALPIEEVLQVHRSVAKEGSAGWSAFDFSKPTLRHLRELGYKAGLISNWDGTAREVLRRNRLEEELDVIVISSEVGAEKPDPAIFQYALQKAGVTAQQSLYVGDNYYDDCVGSRKVGMDCLLINPYGKRGIEELDDERVISGIDEVPAYLGDPWQPDRPPQQTIGRE
ncbi:HAD family hydrolase [Paenibacillus macerans]|uniref:HAD family hydrolase n=1 Tax=Paenibacillus macerans TaxID=44252 RepID=UPI003D30FA51